MSRHLDWERAADLLQAHGFDTHQLRKLFSELSRRLKDETQGRNPEKSWSPPSRAESQSKRSRTRKAGLGVIDTSQAEYAIRQLIEFSKAVRDVSQIDPSDAPHLMGKTWLAAFTAGYWAAAAKYSRRITAGPLGLALIEGGDKGARRRKVKIDERATKYAKRYVELRKQRPKLLHVRATELVAAEFGVSGRTVRQYVKNPDTKRKRK